MIVEKALRIAGSGSHLVARPAGVAHVYTGPLTSSGRYVPRAGRTICRAHTRRLAVLRSERCSSLDPATRHRALCARCSARLLRGVVRRAEHLSTREQYCQAFAGMTKADVALALEFAQTSSEVDAAAHVSLLLFGHLECTHPVTRPDGRRGPSLHQLVQRTRGRFATRSAADRRFDDSRVDVANQRAAERAAIKHDREERIRRLGINNVKPL